MDLKISKEERHLRAKKRVDELKSFYIHLAVYIIVNLFLSITQIVIGITDGISYDVIFSDIGIYGVWLMWGIGISIHAFKIFGSQFFLGRDWEDKKIKEFMEQNKKQ